MIDADKVGKIFGDCLFQESELQDGKPPANAIVVEGIMGKFGFNPERVAEHKDEIVEMLRQLPHQFHKSSGGGWSFLNACNTEDGEQWTGFHTRMEQLFVLGMAIGKVKFLLPRKMWTILPGGMPYLEINLEG